MTGKHNARQRGFCFQGLFIFTSHVKTIVSILKLFEWKIQADLQAIFGLKTDW